jgi:hypothetical protein
MIDIEQVSIFINVNGVVVNFINHVKKRFIKVSRYMSHASIKQNSWKTSDTCTEYVRSMNYQTHETVQT